MWRTSFGLGGIPLLFMLYYRIFRLRESAVWRANNAVRTKASRNADFFAMFAKFWPRCAHLLSSALSAAIILQPAAGSTACSFNSDYSLWPVEYAVSHE